jgi:choline dehydrogenase
MAAAGVVVGDSRAVDAARDPGAAVRDSEFRVKGTRALRVVDASVFPELPRFLPVVAVMRVGEKAADVIQGGAEALD